MREAEAVKEAGGRGQGDQEAGRALREALPLLMSGGGVRRRAGVDRTASRTDLLPVGPVNFCAKVHSSFVSTCWRRTKMAGSASRN